MLKKFFLLCSGADKDIMATCSNGEQNKFVGIGATVFFTAVMAFLSASYALYTVFDNYYSAVAFGLVWSLLIFNLDRFIVSTLRKRNHWQSELLQATPRLVLAIIIAIVISKPLELKIFEKEINTVLVKEQNQLALQNKEQVASYFQKDLVQNQQQIDSLKSEIGKKEKEVNELYSVYITEAEGTSGTKKMGKGLVYKEKREKHDRALQELDTLKNRNAIKIKALESQVEELKKNQEAKIKSVQPVLKEYNGIMARIDALGELSFWPSFFIMLLFLAVETAPVLVKMMTARGEYDFKLEDQENAVKQILVQFKEQQEVIQQVENEIQDKLKSELVNDTDLYDEKRKHWVGVLKDQAKAYTQKQQKVIKNL
ncbi:DUF4407 domain-containing protein [Flavobacterium sediminis]|uniref:DUF4407 domain-containing protein n=1 Tax=Flavobacterium sediminis TaxID=2201181 RepID=A0A2U8QV59_9FLAO|nr:DUF4407 domain-containing protein [Flavobacterium sediminis]AWM13931.1 DUF4407 domain-containing protein [Flavobacterium sediminis]